MGKAQRNRIRRADHHRRRNTRLDGLTLDGWHTVGLTDLDDADFDDVAFPGPPDDALLDTTDCPVADRCAGCGAVSGIRAVTSAFSKPGGYGAGYDVGCATLCGVCDGRSFLHLLDPAELEQAFARHAAHPHRASPAPRT
ncbi:hypothetical protein [Actinophytocola sediminis]